MEKKFPEPDPEFYMKVRKAAMNDYQRGIVFILQATGMHLQCLVSLTPSQMNVRGDILWRRTKTARPMRARIPKMDRREVRDWIRNFGSNNRTGRWVQYNLKEVGLRAGFPDLSPMTFRTQRAVRLLDDGEPYHEVAHLMGCSPSVLMANYAQLKEDRKVDLADVKDVVHPYDSPEATAAFETLEDLGACYHPDNASGHCHYECNHFNHETDQVGDGDCHWHYPNRWGREFKGSPCGSCGHNTSGDAMDSDQCADAGCDGSHNAWTPPVEEVDPDPDHCSCGDQGCPDYIPPGREVE